MSSEEDVPGSRSATGTGRPADPRRPMADDGALPRQGEAGTGGPVGAVGGAGRAGGAEGAGGAGGPVGNGWLLGDRYRLGDRLGSGGMGTVWRARDERIGREVAVKEPRIPASVTGDEREVALARMHREAHAAASIDHPNVVDIHDVVLVDGEPWLVMELVLGQSLDHLLTEGTLSPQQAANIALPVLGALTAAHEKGVLHRDVKPANVLLGSFDRVVLADFGIAQIEGEKPLTETGHFIGSLAYMAPERALGRKPGPESDLFSLGVLLYAALEGFVPFQRQTQAATLHAVIDAVPADPSQAGVLAPLIVQLLNKDPAGRPGVERIASVLRSVAGRPGGDLPTGEHDSGVGRRPPGRGRRRARAVLAGVAVAAVAAAGGWLAPWSSPLSPDAKTGRAELPDGWKLHRLTLQHAELPAPADFKRQRSAVPGQVIFAGSLNGTRYDIRIKRAPNQDNSTTQQIARKQHHDFFADPKYTGVNYVYDDFRVDEKKATEQIATFRNSEGKNSRLMYRKRQVYCEGRAGVDWWLTVNMTPHTPDGSDPWGDNHIFRTVVDQVRLKDS